MYDIGLYGLWYGNNYGSQITYYALRYILQSMGNSVLMIENPLCGDTYVQEHLDRSGPYQFASRHNYAVSELLPLNEMYKLNDQCRKFMIGSDQMWNFYLSRPYRQSYFLDFVDDDKVKVSYATSFGLMKYKGTEKDRVKTANNLEKFSAVSVRDGFSREILKYDFHISAKQVIDPVFLCDKEVYEELLVDLPDEYQGDFIFAYFLDPNRMVGNTLCEIAEKTGMKILFIPDLGAIPGEAAQKLGLHDDKIRVWERPTLEQWITCLVKSKYVLTDSYHGTIFSVIFRKPFLVKKNLKRGSGRFDDLMDMLSLPRRMVKNATEMGQKFGESGLDNVIDYNAVEQRLLKKQEDSLRWLKKALEPERIEQNSVAAVLDQKMCVGCSACSNVCPSHAIEMGTDLFGYYKARTNYGKCIGCGKCVRVCPAIELPDKKNAALPDCYEFIAAEESIRDSSTSGGVFSLLARQILRRQGYVTGAAWTEDFYVQHIMINREEDLGRLRKSKYMQSSMGDIFPKVKEKLESRKKILFSGCPCQVAGLKKYLGKEYDNLLLVDVLCGNAPSAWFFRKYLLSEFPEGVLQYQFREKKYGWNADCISLTLKDGTRLYRKGSKQDSYQRVYHSHVMCPPHCEHCRYQEAPRFGDITIGDFWGIGQVDPEIKTKDGVSVVLCNNEKGRKYIDSIMPAEIRWKKKVPVEWLGGNGFAFHNHNWIAPQRDEFYNAILKLPFKEAVNYALKPNHGEYRAIYDESSTCLQYETRSLRFHLEEDVWEEHYINGKTVLFVKKAKVGIGHYATMALNKCLRKDVSYNFKIRFRVQSKSDILNFHVKDSGSVLHQIIYSCDIRGKNDGNKWIKVDAIFSAETDFYDEFMLGASQISGKRNFLEIDYIYISAQDD